MERWERGTLPAGQVVTGPALIEDAWSTTLVYPGQRCQADGHGHLRIEAAP
jgi:N-methylhydantoinase A/oxoprolinase/acetone carboxylase beta subunit